MGNRQWAIEALKSVKCRIGAVKNFKAELQAISCWLLAFSLSCEKCLLVA